MLKFHCRDRTETYITIEKYGNTMCLGKTSEADVKHPINTCFKIGATAYGASFSGSCSNSTNGFPIPSKAIIERYELEITSTITDVWPQNWRYVCHYVFFFSSYAGTANTCNTGDASNRPVTFKAFLEKTCSTSAASTSVNQYTCGDKCEFTISIIHANCWSAYAYNIHLCIYDSTLQHWWRFHKRMQLRLRHRHKFN